MFYRHGGDAVALFFSLSGFIFFWLFAQAVARQELTAKQFFIDRFSRVYPLHLATFAGVALLQMIYTRHTGNAFVYPFNDLYHAVLNLFLAPAWGLEQGWSFNAPAWSVSVEVLLYALFFLLWRYTSFPVLFSVMLVGVAVYLFPGQYKITLGVFSFFCGGLAYRVVTWLSQRGSARWVGGGLVIGCAAAWWLLDTDQPLTKFALLFPLTIMAIAACHRLLEPLARRLAWLGDISYASYLLHFPLQIVAALLADKFFPGRSVFYQPWTLLLFFAVLITASLVCHRGFERPLQRWLRQPLRQCAAGDVIERSGL
ncbi:MULTISPECIES: acyltransferase [unclassified Pseudomonas]|uniref:acyltransferase family protein n=1 Tax=unclassified Pseudomonas TaxID=196821 RepID=UPI002AC922E1|nr:MULTISPECIES: acyltransferase [unclassified Pseudomonas]MEB0045819.1 acyltransferase [Pseudomonas sp. Dout3]MEB0096693.1 acyltransferase [Pseudomonas sp. DC1.2]WPX60186.1 acyltransferase [Pseudomonas sp. DC1.2]